MNYRPITDSWILARPKVKYYGAYPNGFLERARALLGVSPYDALLHVCGGKARDYPAKPRGFGPNDKTLDLDASLNPDFLQAATDPLPGYGVYCDPLRAGQPSPWPAIIMDPPYTVDDADKYQPGRAAFPSANKMLRNALDAVRVGGRVGMLHYILPQPPREGVRFVACISVIVGYNNRMRCFSVFEKEEPKKAKERGPILQMLDGPTPPIYSDDEGGIDDGQSHEGQGHESDSSRSDDWQRLLGDSPGSLPETQ